jgi:hypothetical protein
VLKLDRLALTRCKVDSDCVAVPIDCCGGTSVAVRKDEAVSLQKRMCPRIVTCPAVALPAQPVACRRGRCAIAIDP